MRSLGIGAPRPADHYSSSDPDLTVPFMSLMHGKLATDAFEPDGKVLGQTDRPEAGGALHL